MIEHYLNSYRQQRPISIGIIDKEKMIFQDILILRKKELAQGLTQTAKIQHLFVLIQA